MRHGLRPAYALITLVIAAAWLNFLWYFGAPERLAHNIGPVPTVLDMLLRVVLAFVLLQNPIMNLLTWLGAGLLTRRPFRRELGLPDPATTRVAFITTYVPGAEPISMLAQTLKGMVLADFPHDTWVLDEGDDPQVKRVARMLGVKYFTRHGIPEYNTTGGTFSKKTKGGNHNAWYDAYGLGYDFVAQIDTDFQPRRDFLTKTLVHFADPRIGWVGTPQIYGNDESFVARGAGEQTYGFYGVLMNGLATVGSTLLIGANHVIRVATLKDADLYAAHLCEDIATGIKLHAKGWRSVYVHEPLLIGEGPTDWTAYFKQQFRWAKGSIDLGLTAARVELPRMRAPQALMYSWLLFFYYNGAAFGMGVLLLGLQQVLGVQAISAELVPFLAAYVPVVLACEVGLLWAQRLHVRPLRETGLLLRSRVLTVACMPVYLAAFLAAIRDLGTHTEFEVTDKGQTTGSAPVPVARPAGAKRKPSILRPHRIVTAIAVGAAAVGLVLGHLDALGVFWVLATALPLALASTRPTWRIVRFRAKRMSLSLRRRWAHLEAGIEERRDALTAFLGPDHGDPDVRLARLAHLHLDLADLESRRAEPAA